MIDVTAPENNAPAIRVLDGEDALTAAEAVFRTAMVGLPSPREPEPGRILTLREPGRTLGAFLRGDDGGGELLAGATDATSGAMTVPGGARVAHAAVTHVGVLPTHTRRGVVSALMRRQLRDARERGEVVASLRASEAVIYERFGYGIASTSRSVDLDLRRAALRPQIDADGPVRLVSPEESWDLLQHIVDKHPNGRPGAISRSEYWWNGRRSRPSQGPRYVAVFGPPGAETGFASYRPVDTHAWFGSRDRTVLVDDFHAPTPAAQRALVAFLMRLDLVDTVRFWTLPEDDPLPWMITDHRAAKVTGISDETWLRLVDVPAALAARTYGPSGADEPVLLEVRDDILPGNEGVYRIGPAGAERVTTGRPDADASVDVAGLASAYLGGARWHQLLDAGIVRARDAETPTRLDALFATPTAPFAGVMF